MSGRRQRVPGVDEAFERVVRRVERAKEDLVTAVPSPRGAPGRPVAEALAAFEEGLRSAADELDRWRSGDGAVRRSCRGAIGEALVLAERLRLEAPPLDYEGLVSVLGDLIAPLDAFGDAERALRARHR